MHQVMQSPQRPSRLVAHLVSDSTGETVTAALTAAFARYAAEGVERRLHVFVRRREEVERVTAEIAAAPGPVFFTVLDPEAGARIAAAAEAAGVAAVDVMAPIVAALDPLLDRAARAQPGGQHDVDRSYFARVAAIDFAIGHDDGAAPGRYGGADVILAGVSRSSKTPTCIYLACRGVKAANLPLTPGAPPPPEFHAAVAAGVPVIGLTVSPTRLAQIRALRLERLGRPELEGYADLDAIRAELAEARLFFERIGAPVIDVTRRSIEETAAAVMAELRARRPAGEPRA
jgi:regulator of PEP synthase PpsR (kinase-PPPase family)